VDAGQRIPEKGFNLDVATRLQSLLRRSGFRTVLTRQGDYFVSLDERCAIANRERTPSSSASTQRCAKLERFRIETYYCAGGKARTRACAPAKNRSATVPNTERSGAEVSAFCAATPIQRSLRTWLSHESQ